MSGSLAIAASVLAMPAVAGEFQWGDWEGSFNSQISLGSSWRMSEMEPLLVTPGNAPGLGTASSGTADDGDLNYEDGDIYSLILKGVHDFELRKGDFGLFLRGKYWYDQELENGKRPHGTSSNLYTPNQTLDDSGFDDYAKASGIALLDAFVYGTFYLGENDMPLDLFALAARWRAGARAPSFRMASIRSIRSTSPRSGARVPRSRKACYLLQW
jgi:hypothetical protein